MTKNELKSECPFCGGKARMYNDSKGYPYIECTGRCAAVVFFKKPVEDSPFPVKEMTEKRWNSRVRKPVEAAAA